jgi:hypothetical protein
MRDHFSSFVEARSRKKAHQDEMVKKFTARYALVKYELNDKSYGSSGGLSLFSLVSNGKRLPKCIDYMPLESASVCPIDK